MSSTTRVNHQLGYLLECCRKKTEVEKIREELKSLNETPVIKEEPLSDKDEKGNI